MSSRSHHADSSEDAEPPRPRPASRMDKAPAPRAADELPDEGYVPRPDPEAVDPLIVASSRDIDDMVRDMLPYYDGRETEENWVMRERNVITLRRLTRGNAPQSFPTHYLNAIKTLLDGIFKVVNSLRTTLCTAGCLLIQDIARTCGSKVDSMVEIMMQNLIKLCGGMKKISTQSGNTTVDVVIANVTFTPRIFQHVNSAAQDRNAQLRLYAAGWIRTILSKQATRYKSIIEHAGGLDSLDKSIRKGLGDANPSVRETMRSTFWVFHQVWPGKADEIIATLDSKSRTLLERDPGNPNAGQASTAGSKTPTSKKGFSSSASAAPSGRSALKEAIAAQKRAHLSPGKALPPRPESAQSTFTDARVSEAAAPPRSTTTTTTTSTTRTIPTGSHVSSLSSAPMRPAMKPRRPELNRPATADPYARRPGDEPRSRGTTPKGDGSPRAVRTRPSATPSSKTTGVTRPRQKTDPTAPTGMGSTMSKPKKLDISSKSRLHDGVSSSHGHGQGHSRHGSHDSTIHSHHSERGRDSPAPIQLESPPGPAAVRDGSLHEPSSIALPPSSAVHSPIEPELEPELEPEPMQEQEQEQEQEPVQDSTVPEELDDDPEVVARKQPAPVHIYEDPTTPAEPEATADEMFISADTSVRDEHEGPEPVVATEAVDEPEVAAEPVVPAEEEDQFVDAAESGPEREVEQQQPQLQDSPAKTPVSKVSPERPTARANSVLEEIPNNEPAQRDNKPPAVKPVGDKASVTPDASHRRWKKFENDRRRSLSPRSKDPVKAREMLEKGVQRIRTRTMDILGYRKLQGLIENHEGVFETEAKYDDMLTALLAELESAPEEKRQSIGRPMDLKTQVLVTIRFMFRHNAQYFAAYHAQAMTALIGARKRYVSSSHISSGLEETADEIISVCDAGSVITAVLDQLDAQEPDEEGYRAITMGTSVLSRLVRNSSTSSSASDALDSSQVERLGRFCGGHLTDRQPDVRRQVTDLSVALYRRIGDESRFWEVLGSPRENSRNLLTYYIHR